MINSFNKYFKPVIGIFLFSALLSANDAVYSNSVISLQEIPEWAPARALQIRHITINGTGIGTVVVTEGDIAAPLVSQVAQFEYDTKAFLFNIEEYEQYKSFYGVNEDQDGRIVEGNPQTVVLSFFNDGQIMKSISLSGTFAYSSDAVDGQFNLPTAVIRLRDKLLAYAKHAKPQPKAKYYTTILPYNDNQRYWLLKSVKLESIPVITDLSDERDLEFLDELIRNAPTFIALGRQRFLRLKRNMNLSDEQFKRIFRTSEESDAIVEVKFVRSTPS